MWREFPVHASVNNSALLCPRAFFVMAAFLGSTLLMGKFVIPAPRWLRRPERIAYGLLSVPVL